MNRLKELRREKKLSQKEIADFLGVNEKTISRWEKSESTIKSDKAHKLADFFGVSVGYLLGYTNFKNTDDYFNSIDDILDIDVLNSIDTIGEKNLPLVFDFFKESFIEEYSKIETLVNGESVDRWNMEESVKVAMGNVMENLWGLPDNLVKLILYWATLKNTERDSLLEIIKSLSLNNIQ